MSEVKEFEREARYVVLKISDLHKLHDSQTEGLRIELARICRRLPKRDFLVIESNWPEYEPAWQAIERRMTGKPADDFDAQRLRADTAEADVQEARNTIEAVSELLLAYEQRIAELIEFIRDSADSAQSAGMLKAFINQLDAALNPNPEAESHELAKG